MIDDPAPASWARVQRILQAVLERPPAERAGFLHDECGNESALRAEVEALLRAHAEAGSFLMDSPLDALGGSGEADRPLLPGDRLGPYEIAAWVGAGGMGDVYKARDTRLGRMVAVKVLSSSLRSDPSLQERFEREARTLATLSHPHICPVYDVGRENGIEFLVMEYLDGQTLAARIAKGVVPIEEALRIATAIADALDTAHQRGIIHRDLKPANINIAPDGVVKVLDFGLAKLAAGQAGRAGAPEGPALSNATLSTVGGTKPGVVLGTPAYMSPEQARATPVDSRTDVWAFGCVLYEMLAGRAAFAGASVTDTLAAIVEHDPDWEKLPATTPPLVRSLLRRCLQKDRTRRLRDVADARFQIDDALSVSASPPTVAAPTPIGRRRERLVWVAALIAVAAGAALGARFLARQAGPDELRLEVTTPPTRDPTSFAISPDGKTLVFVATSDGQSVLWLRPLAAESARPLAGTDGATRPFWSPDSRSIGFSAVGQLKRIDVDNGSVRVLGQGGKAGGTWSREGTIVFSSGMLFHVSAQGGESSAVLPANQHVAVPEKFPQFLPDGVHFLFSWLLTPPGIYVAQFGASEPPRRIVDAELGLFASPGHLLFVRQGTLFAQRFNPRRLQLEGSPTAVADHIVTGGTSGEVALSASAAGLVAYRAGQTGVPSHFVWYDRAGIPLEPVAGSEFAVTGNSSLSPDGNYLASNRPASEGPADIWVLDVRRGGIRRLTTDPRFDMVPVWSPDGRRLAFGSNRNGDFDTYVKFVDGTGTEELLAGGDNGPPSDWSADGGFILLTHRGGSPGDVDIWAVPVGDRKSFPVVATTFEEGNGQFSPDGRWIAFQSNESGPTQIYVQPFPGPGRKWLISTDGGTQARWRRDGEELFYLAPDNSLMAVPIRLDAKKGTVDVDRPVSLFNPPLVAQTARQYMVSPDGKRFLMQIRKEVTIPITVIVNWKPKS